MTLLVFWLNTLLTFLFLYNTEPSTQKKSGFIFRIRRKSADGRSGARMASGQGEAVLRDLTHPNLNEHLKNHNAVSFKLVKTGEWEANFQFAKRLALINCATFTETVKRGGVIGEGGYQQFCLSNLYRFTFKCIIYAIFYRYLFLFIN